MSRRAHASLIARYPRRSSASVLRSVSPIRALAHKAPVRRRILIGIGAAFLSAMGAFAGPARAQDVLASLEHHVVGAQLIVGPSELFVPKDIPGSLSVDIGSATGITPPELARLGHGTHVEAVLRGPAFPAYRLLGLPNEPLRLPPIALVGDYRIDDIRLVDTTTGDVLLMGTPDGIDVRVFPEVLVSQVTSRPLTIDEIQARGIVIDASNFTVLEFSAMFQLAGRPIAVDFPVVSPRYVDAVEIISDAELNERLAEAERLNRSLSTTIELPEALRVAGLDIQVQGINFERVLPDGEGISEVPPVIPALVVIPGHIGFLNQFFSVKVYTANASPQGSGLEVHNLTAEITLPPGKDRVLGNEDDPLALARFGESAQTQDVVAVRGLGQDGVAGTSDDVGRLGPGRSGEGEFVVEGRRPGLHTMDIRLRGVLDGLAAGEVEVQGTAVGSVLVRNPAFSMVFSHPRTVRAGEPYTAAVTILNTSETAANLVGVNLLSASISGAELASGSSETVELGTIQPGESRTAEYHLVARRTGTVRFSNLVLDDGLSGRFDLTMGVDERGVELSAGVILYPEWVEALPPDLKRAADRVLGQALSVATAGTLPPGVRTMSEALVFTRVRELTEAGQRLYLGDEPARVLPDLLLDWLGGRAESAGFEQVLRETNAGFEFLTVLVAELQAAGSDVDETWLSARLPDWAGRGESWAFAFASRPDVEVSYAENGLAADGVENALPHALLVPGGSGRLLTVRNPGTRDVPSEVTFRVRPDTPSATASWIALGPDGSGQRETFSLVARPEGDTCYRILPSASVTDVVIDHDCNHTSNGTVTTTSQTITELPPTILGARQDLQTAYSRPLPCGGPTFQGLTMERPYRNYGNLVAVLFSKPIDPESLDVDAPISFDNGVLPLGASLQSGGRVALVGLRSAIGTLRERSVVASSALDVHGAPVGATTVPVVTIADEGVSLRGRVIGRDGNPAPGVPVTLTMHDLEATPTGCYPVDVRAGQTFTDANGEFTLDFVMAGVPYSIAATDIRGLDPEAVAYLLEASPTGIYDPELLEQAILTIGGPEDFAESFGGLGYPRGIAIAQSVDRAVLRDQVDVGGPRVGSEVPVALRFRGRGAVEGYVFAEDGTTPVSEVAVNLFPDAGSRELGRGVFSNSSGYFRFDGVPVGPFTVDATGPTGRHRTVAGQVVEPGSTVRTDVVLPATAANTAHLVGTVFESDQVTPHAGATVYALNDDGQAFAVAAANGDGHFELRDLPVPDSNTVSVIAVSSRGTERGQVDGRAFFANETTYVGVFLQGTTRVDGRVVYADGSPVEGASVAGGRTLVTTSSQGFFSLYGVPIGTRSIAAGISPPPPGMARVAEASLEVTPGGPNFVEIELPALGRIAGVVLNQGSPVGGEYVAIPRDTGFQWTRADSQGRFLFDAMRLGRYTVAAPAPPVTDAEAAIDALASRNRDLVLTAVGAVFERYASGFASDGGYTGAYGFTSAELVYDGQIEDITVRYLPRGTISGIVLNPDDVPIGAEVVISGTKRGPTGAPWFGEVARVQSDPATGEFSWSGLNAGAFALSAESPFFVGGPSLAGATTTLQPDSAGHVLRFPPTSSPNGRLVGTVLEDGQPVVDALVRINVSDDYEIRTNAEGRFSTGPGIVLGGQFYTIEVTNPASGRFGHAQVRVTAGQTTDVTIPLLAADGRLRVVVEYADGSAAAGAVLRYMQLQYPRHEGQTTPLSQGEAVLQPLVEGSYSVEACLTVAQTRHCAQDTAVVTGGTETLLTLILGPSGVISGTYVEADGTTPVPDAQISIGRYAFATTDATGAFSVEGIPLGIHTITGRNPTTGRAALTDVNLSFDGQNRVVLLREDTLGEVRGQVIAANAQGFEPNAEVTLNPSHPLFPPTTVTTGTVGDYFVPGVPPGDFVVTAVNEAEDNYASETRTMPTSGGALVVDLTLESRATLPVVVLTAAGGPASATVRGAGQVHDTDASGTATFVNLPMGTVEVVAQSTTGGRTRSLGHASVAISQPGTASTATITLSGVGEVTGTITTALSAPAVSTLVRLSMPTQGAFTTTTDAQGEFTFSNVELGDLELLATSGAQAARTTTELLADGDVAAVTLQLSHSATVSGTLVRADQVSPVAGATVLITYQPQSSVQGATTTLTDGSGNFTFSGIPDGDFDIEVHDIPSGGILRYQGSILVTETDVDLGVLVLDEDTPTVSASSPTMGATNVAITDAIEITFSEPMDPAYPTGEGARLVDALVSYPFTATWSDAYTLVVQPDVPLTEETRYSFVLVAGDAQSLGAGITGSGPRDLAGRSLATPFWVDFTTRDSTPPALDSFAPADGAVQVAPEAVVRLDFDESIDPASLQVTLRDSTNAEVPATLSVLPGNEVVVLTPNGFLAPNTSYQATLAAVSDVAGNAMPGLPLVHSFATLDTVGPVVTDIVVLTGEPLIDGTVAQVQATIANNESPVGLELTADLATFYNRPLGTDLTVAFPVPVGGPDVTLYVRAVDRYGNHGPYYQETFSITPNLSPVVSIERVTPATGALLTGQPYSLRLVATDDGQIMRIVGEISGAFADQQTLAGAGPLLLEGIVPAALGPGNSVVVTAEAEDDAAALSTVETLTLSVEDGVAPALAVSWPGLLVDPGAVVTVPVTVTDAFGANDLSFETSALVVGTSGGALQPAQTSYQRDFEFTVPGGANGGDEIIATVRATDEAGFVTTATAGFVVRDAVPPQVATVTPVDGATDVSLLPTITVGFTEAVFGVNGSTFVLTGPGGPVLGNLAFTPGAATASFTPSASLTPGGTYSLSLTGGVIDAAGNGLVAFSSGFTVVAPDVEGPQLLAVQPASGASNAELLQPIVFEFDEAIDATSLTEGRATLERVQDAALIAATVSLESGAQFVRLVPDQALQVGTQYRAHLSGQLTDAAGNPLRDAAGQTFSELVVDFTTANVEITVPGVTHVVEGHAAVATIVAESGAPVSSANWTVEGVSVGSSVGSAPTWTVAVPSLAAQPSGILDIGADILVATVGMVSVPTLTATIAAADGDADGDGLTNDQEATAGTDPWSSDATEDPDNDGLTNADEIGLGTNPFDDDTDGDGLPDGSDPAPLNGNRRPSAGAAALSMSLGFSGTGTEQLSLPAAARRQAPVAWELWVNPTGSGVILTSGGNGAVSVGYDGPTQAFSFSAVTDTHGVVSAVAPLVSTAGLWHHIAFVYDGARVRGFVDGLLATDLPLQGSLLYEPGGSLQVGPSFAGQIDEIRLWHASRSAVELQENMHRLQSEAAPGLAGYWRLDDGSGNLAADATGLASSAGLVAPDWRTTNPAPLLDDVFVQVGGPNAFVDLDSEDLDGDTIIYQVAALPQHGRIYDTDGAGGLGVEVVTVPSTVQAQVVYQQDPGYLGTDSFEFVALDGTFESRPARVAIDIPPSKLWVGGDSVGPWDWHTAANWSPVGVPTAADSVQIPSGLPSPVVVSANAATGTINIGAGTIVDLGSSTLTVSGHLANDGLIQGSTAKVRLDGPSVWARGVVPALEVVQDVQLTGNVDVATGNLTVEEGGVLEIGGFSVSVAGNLAADGQIVMTDDAGSVDVEGVAVFNSGPEAPSMLSAGSLTVGGAHLWSYGNSVLASGSHTTVLDGTGTQELWVGAGTRLQNLSIQNTVGVNLTTDLTILGSLTVNGTFSSSHSIVVNAADFAAAAVVVLSGHLEVASLLHVEAGASVGLGALDANTIDVEATASVVIQTLEARTGAPLHGSITYTNLVLHDAFTLSDSVSLDGDLTILESGSLELGVHDIAVGGNLSALGPIGMSDPACSIDVEGFASFNSGSATPSILSAGTLLVGGSYLWSYGSSIQASGSHLIVLDGDGLQDLWVQPDSSIESITVTNQVGVNLITPLTVLDTLTVTGALSSSRDVVSEEALFGSLAVVALSGRLEIDGTLEVEGGASANLGHLRAGAYVVNGAAALVAQRLEAQAGTPLYGDVSYTDLELLDAFTLSSSLAVAGDVVVGSAGSLSLGVYSLSVGGDFAANGPIAMASSGAVLDVEGSADFNSEALAPSLVSAGSLLVGGAHLWVYGSSLVASGSHRVVLDGVGSQQVWFEDSGPGGSRLQNLQVQNSVGVSLHTSRVIGAFDILGGGVVSLVGNVSADSVDAYGELNVGVGVDLAVTSQFAAHSTATVNNAGVVTAGVCAIDPSATMTGNGVCP